MLLRVELGLTAVGLIGFAVGRGAQMWDPRILLAIASLPLTVVGLLLAAVAIVRSRSSRVVPAVSRSWRSLAVGLVAVLLIAACTTPESTIGPAPTVIGTVTAGPVCPVERSPTASGCAPRPVAGAVIVASDTNGTEITRTTTAADGSYLCGIPRAETVIITALPVEGLARPPGPVTVTVAPNAQVRVDLEYDTGIR